MPGGSPGETPPRACNDIWRMQTLPEQCPFGVAQVLDPDWFPEPSPPS